jgi:hypothetical protein
MVNVHLTSELGALDAIAKDALDLTGTIGSSLIAAKPLCEPNQDQLPLGLSIQLSIRGGLFT